MLVAQIKEYQGKDTVIIPYGHSHNTFFSPMDTVIIPFPRNIFFKKREGFFLKKSPLFFQEKRKNQLKRKGGEKKWIRILF